jgi:hypothetical protein
MYNCSHILFEREIVSARPIQTQLALRADLCFMCQLALCCDTGAEDVADLLWPSNKHTCTMVHVHRRALLLSILRCFRRDQASCTHINKHVCIFICTHIKEIHARETHSRHWRESNTHYPAPTSNFSSNSDGIREAALRGSLRSSITPSISAAPKHSGDFLYMCVCVLMYLCGCMLDRACHL